IRTWTVDQRAGSGGRVRRGPFAATFRFWRRAPPPTNPRRGKSCYLKKLSRAATANSRRINGFRGLVPGSTGQNGRFSYARVRFSDWHFPQGLWVFKLVACDGIVREAD